MPQLNIHMDDKEKKKLQEHVEKHKKKSMSNFIRKIIDEKIKIDEIESNIEKPKDIKIPEYLPKNKYVAFVKGAVVAVGDNPCELAEEASKKFPDFPFLIKFNGPKQRSMEYIYMSLKEFYAWRYSIVEDQSYPIILIKIGSNNGKEKKKLAASFDTAASLCLLKKGVISKDNLKPIRKEKISTATGIVDTNVYRTNVKILDITFKIEFIIAPISDRLPFKFLIGRNLMDQLDAYFFGKKQTLLLKLAEE